MRTIQHSVFACLMGLALGTGAVAGPAVPGLVSVTPQGQATFYFVDPLPIDQDISMQTPAVKGTRSNCCTRVPRGELKELEAASDQVTSGAGREVKGYVLERPLTGKWGDSGFVGIAMAGARVQQSGKYAVLGRQGKSVTRARLCFGTEGLNLIATRGSQVSSLYYAFGYEVDESPRCSTRDERDLGRVNH